MLHMAGSISFRPVLWPWLVEGIKPDRWDLLGAAVCLIGAAIIFFGPRSTSAG